MNKKEEFYFDKSDGFKKRSHDSDIEERIHKHCKKYNIDSLTALKNFMILIRRHQLKRFLAHHKLFSMVENIPGDICELGVFRGAGLFTWANFLESYAIGDRTKIVYGFDNWSGFEDFSEKDASTDNTIGKEIGGFDGKIYYEELVDAIDIFDSDRFVPQKPRIKLIPGDINKTAPDFVKNNPGVRFSLIHFDCDLYEPTLSALKAFWPVLSKGGVMVFDEYAIHDWPGETAAVDEFFNDKDVEIKTFNWTNIPGAYLVKK